ncbi:hypothetical protein GQ457_10G009790 [Hibiscus cannabinus]
MLKMDVADAAPLNVAMPTPPANPIPEAAARAEDSAPTASAEPSYPAPPAEPQQTPPASPPVVPISSHTTTTSPPTAPAAQEQSRASTPATNLGSTPSSPPSPPAAAQSEEAAPSLQIMLLRSQLQRIEARQIHFQEEMKVFNSNLLKFLQFQFPASATFFGQPSFPPPQPSVSAAAQPSTHTSAKEGATEEVHFSSDDENDIFDWQSPRDHLQPLGPITTTPAPAVPILSATQPPTTYVVAERPTPDSPAKRKGKATAGRTFGRENPSSPEDKADQHPAKRRRRYHVITADSDEEDSSAEIPLRRLESRFVKQLKRLRHYDANIGDFQKEVRRIVKIKDLKPKRIKDYLEYKYPCDNDYKEVTVLPSRDIVYDQVKQLIGLRHKPINQQDAL